MSKLAKDAFLSRNYHLAVELFERCIREKTQQNQSVPYDLYFGYGDSLARSGQLQNAIDVYTYLAYKLDGAIPWERLKHLSSCILNNFIALNSNNNSYYQFPNNTLNSSTILGKSFLSSASYGTKTISSSSSSSTSSKISYDSRSTAAASNLRKSSSTTTTSTTTTTTANVASHKKQNILNLAMSSSSSLSSSLVKNCDNGNCKESILKRKRARSIIPIKIPKTSLSTSSPGSVKTTAASIISSTVTSSVDNYNNNFSTNTINLTNSRLSNVNSNVTKLNLPLCNKNKQILINNNGNINTDAINGNNNYPQQNEHRTNHHRGITFSRQNYNFNITIDPLLCGICEDILRCPVTASCGHTFCRECCYSMNSNNSNNINGELYECHLCQQQKQQQSKVMNQLQNYTNYNNDENTNINNNNKNNNNCNTTILSSNLKPDILVRRLVDKYWSAELQARELNEQAIHFMDIQSLDEALRLCNQSLEKCPKHVNSLILRSEVLYRLNHFKSSLADADSALKCNPTSAKAFYRRALALANLGRPDEAIIAYCITANLDLEFLCRAQPTFKTDLAKLLQCMITSVTRTNHSILKSRIKASAPYCIQTGKTGFNRRHSRRKLRKIAQNINPSVIDDGIERNFDNIISDCDENISSCGEDDLIHHNHHNRIYKQNYNHNNNVERLFNYNSNNYNSSHNNSRCSKRLKNTNNIDEEYLIRNKSTTTLRILLDRIQQEVQKVKRTDNNLNLLTVNPALIDVADFDCVLCCRTLWKPVVTPCGHTYCWVCLDRCMDYSSSCPLCMSPLIEQCYSNYDGSRTPLPFSLVEKSVTRFLETAMKRLIPEWYEKRRRQELESEPSVPVFICTTAFPNVPCPLFVYEPRYRLMVRRAIESGERQFGIVQPNNGKSRYSDIGTMLDIKDSVLLGDGCSILSTIGSKRFKIITRNEKDGYETAKVEYIYDEPISKNSLESLTNKHNKVYTKATRWFESLGNTIKEEILRSFGAMPNLEDNWETTSDGPAWAWWIIAILPLNQQLKVNILETTSLEKRLRAIEKTLDCIIGEDRRSQQQNCVTVPPTACDGLPTCQAVECCQRTSVTANDNTDNVVSNEHHHHHHQHHHNHHHHHSTSYML